MEKLKQNYREVNLGMDGSVKHYYLHGQVGKWKVKLEYDYEDVWDSVNPFNEDLLQEAQEIFNKIK